MTQRTTVPRTSFSIHPEFAPLFARVIQAWGRTQQSALERILQGIDVVTAKKLSPAARRAYLAGHLSYDEAQRQFASEEGGN